MNWNNVYLWWKQLVWASIKVLFQYCLEKNGANTEILFSQHDKSPEETELGRSEHEAET
jgi:hypothetical protein